MLFDISMDVGTFARIVLFGLHSGFDNIWDYTELYTKDPFLAHSSALCLLSLESLSSLQFFSKNFIFFDVDGT